MPAGWQTFSASPHRELSGDGLHLPLKAQLIEETTDTAFDLEEELQA